MANKKTKQLRRKNVRKRKQRGAVYAALIARARFAGVPAHYMPKAGQYGNLIAFRAMVERYERNEPTLCNTWVYGPGGLKVTYG